MARRSGSAAAGRPVPKSAEQLTAEIQYLTERLRQSEAALAVASKAVAEASLAVARALDSSPTN